RINHKLQRKMREHMGDHARLAMPTSEAFHDWRLLQRGLIVLLSNPVRGRHFGHAAKQSFLGTCPHQQLAAARHDERSAPAQLPGLLRRLAWKRLLVAAREA